MAGRKRVLLGALVVIVLAGAGVAAYFAQKAVRSVPEQKAEPQVPPGQEKSLAEYFKRVEREREAKRPPAAPSEEGEKDPLGKWSGIQRRPMPSDKMAELAKDATGIGAFKQMIAGPLPEPLKFRETEKKIDGIVYSVMDKVGTLQQMRQFQSPRKDFPHEYVKLQKEYAEFKTGYEAAYQRAKAFEKTSPEVTEEAKKMLYFRWAMFRLQEAFYNGGAPYAQNK